VVFFLLLFVLTFVVTLWGRRKFRSIYDAEMKNLVGSGMTGAQLAQRILDHEHIRGVEIVRGKGLYADFYDPAKKRLSLAPQHYSGSTFSALGVAAHEAGHVLQDKAGHTPLLWRISAIRATLTLSLPLVIAGLVMLVMPGFLKFIALAGWTLLAAWNLITIPTELDASERSIRVLGDMKPFRNLDERIGIQRVMRSASAYYIDGVFTVISWLGSWVLPGVKKQV